MKSDISGQKQKKKSKKKVNIKWIITIFLSTMVISAVFSTISNMLLGQAGLVPAFFILLVIVLIGILFDIIGVAVTAADVKPFHSMAAHRVPGAQEALKLLRNAEKVSSFCNDVVGDICGIISGTGFCVHCATNPCKQAVRGHGCAAAGDWYGCGGFRTYRGQKLSEKHLL